MRSIVPCIGLGVIALLALTWAATAAPKTTGNPFRRTPASGSPEYPVAHEPASIEQAPRIKMSYMRASWQKVLQDLAEATQTQLVCDKFPKKPFSRLDRRAYSPDEALRIVNNEIEPQGFRAMFKGNFLVVIDLPSARTEYPRAVIPAGGAGQKESAGGDSIEQTSGNLPEIPAPKPATKTTPIRTRQQAARADSGAADQVAWQLLPENDPKPASPEPAQAEASPAEETSQTSIRLRKRDAVSISRIIYRAFKAQAELIEQGPGGLQGFRVFAPTESDGKADAARSRGIRFAVGIDDENNLLVVEAGARETRAVMNLIRSLDTLPTAQQPMVRAVTTTKDAGHIAAALQPELDRLSSESRKIQRRNLRGFDDDLADAADPQERDQQPAQGRAQPRTNIPPEAMPQPGGQPDLQSIVGALKSDVTVEAVPDLGVVILRGNQADVDQVMEIIRQIEKLSAGTAPDVELVLLRHVNSESLATLLTSLYERLAGGGRPRTGQASTSSVGVIPVVRPNAVLVVAGAADMDKVLSLIDNLDQPGEPTAEFKTFKLKYAIPDQVVAAITALYPVPTAQGGQQTTAGLTPIVRAFADVRTNSIIVQARPADMREVSLLIHNMDIDKSASVNKLRIFPLQNAMADELAVTLQLAIQSVLAPARVTTTGQQGQLGAGAGAAGAAGAGTMTELRDVRSTILELMGPDGKDKSIRSGILADIRISSDSRTNSLVVTAPEQSMTLMAELIQQLDKPAAAVAEIKVFTLKNGDATATASLLQALFTGQQQGQGGQGRGGLGQNQNQAIGFQIAGEDATSTLIPVRFSVDVRTNSIIGIGGAEALRVAEAIIYRLDESDIRQRQNAVHRLKNTPALDVANAIAQFLQTQQQVIQQDPAFLSPFEQFEREVVVVPEPVNNSLLISATPRYFKDIMDLIKELDAPPKQVIIQALLVEVTLDNTDEWGVELGLQDSILFSRSLVEQAPITVSQTNTSPNGVQTTTQSIIGQTAIPGFLFNNQPFGNNTQTNLDTGRIGPQGLSNFSLGRINGDLGYGGLVLSAGSESVSVLLRALAARRRVDVLSRPQVRTLDNQIAQIQVGQEIRVVQSVTTNAQTGFSTPNVQARQIGIILSVTPRINTDGVVVMEVAARKEALNPRGIPLIAQPNGTTIDSPIIDTTNALTTVSVRSGQTAVIGGMITKSDDNQSRKVPILGDIPYLGTLFRYDSQKVRRTELLIFLTPRVIQSDEEAEMIKQIEVERMNFIEEEAAEIHGPLFGAPGEADWIRPGAAPGEMYYQPQNGTIPPPLTIDDPNVPTTIMQGESNQIPAMPQDENLQLQGNRRTRRDQKVMQTDYREDSDEPSEPGRARLTQAPVEPGRAGGKATQVPRGKSGAPGLNMKPLKRSSAAKSSK